MKAIFITLGHNSSVVYFNNNKMIGYEQERLDNIKSSSASPEDALLTIIKQVGINELKNIDVYISDWFDFNQETSELSKYYSDNLVRILSDLNSNIHRLSPNFTHHDAHAYAVKAFLNDKNEKIDDYHVIVADGFGNDGEVISVYEKEKDDLVLTKRVYGYNYSMGLMYQYATSFVGLTENKDEYKFVAYETKIDSFLDKIKLEKLIKWSNVFVENTFNEYKISDNKIKTGLFSYKSDLKNTKLFIHSILSDALKDIYENSLNDIFRKYDYKYSNNMTEDEIFELRSVIGYIVQHAIEETLCKIVSFENMQSVLVVGGIFNNVKLNKTIIDTIPNKFVVHPVCGDQGCAFGFFEKKYPGILKYGDFKYGIRDLKYIHNFDKSIHVFEDIDKFVENVSDLIADNKIVNLVMGNLEFGPRALCNTSTVCLPTMENVKIINEIDGRDDVMPMAPVILSKYFHDLFVSNAFDKVIGSDEFMGVTYSYKQDILNNPMYDGIMLKYPHINEYSGRPQIVFEDSIIGQILAKVYEKSLFKCIINTSFNIHGVTIPLTKSDIIFNNKEQFKNDKTNKIRTVILC